MFLDRKVQDVVGGVMLIASELSLPTSTFAHECYLTTTVDQINTTSWTFYSS
jgi:hypothetical protein